jgi:hypothetical protein
MPPANAPAPVAGKQNAGWYRYKVGDFEVTVVTDGRAASARDSYVGQHAKDFSCQDLEAQFPAQDKVIHTIYPVVINTGSKLVRHRTGRGSAPTRSPRVRSASITRT